MYANVGGANYNPLEHLPDGAAARLLPALGFDVNPGSGIPVTLPFLLLIRCSFLVIYALASSIRHLRRSGCWPCPVVLGLLSWQRWPSGTVEQPLMLCLLIGCRCNRGARLAGVLAGRRADAHDAVVPLIALGVLLLLGRDWRALFSRIGALVAAIGFAVSRDRRDTLYSLQWRARQSSAATRSGPLPGRR